MIAPGNVLIFPTRLRQRDIFFVLIFRGVAGAFLFVGTGVRPVGSAEFEYGNENGRFRENENLRKMKTGNLSGEMKIPEKKFIFLGRFLFFKYFPKIFIFRKISHFHFHFYFLRGPPGAGPGSDK